MPILNRPEDMARITTPEQARVFIQQQIEDVRAQVGRAADQGDRQAAVLRACQPWPAA